MDFTAVLAMMKEAPEGTVIDVEFDSKAKVPDFEVIRWNGTPVSSDAPKKLLDFPARSVKLFECARS